MKVPHVSINSAKTWWPSLSLARQFTLASSALVLIGLGVLGFWVSNNIEEGIKQHAAARTALYMESVVAPHLQELSTKQRLSEESIRAIDLVLANDAKRMRVEAAKVWTRDGSVVYASRKELIGQRFLINGPLARAWSGQIEIEFDVEPHLDFNVEPNFDRAPIAATNSNETLLEIYVPIRDAETGNIIAVAEFYEISTDLERKLDRAKMESWIVTALVSFSIIAGLYSIVAKGSKTIEIQRTSLADRIELLSVLLQQNQDLRMRVQRASRRAAEDSELHLRRLGSDLHDGPAQLLALALLKLDQMLDGPKKRPEDRATVRGVLNDAMSEIRDISAGLALPEIERLSLLEALMLIVAEHVRRTATRVSCALPNTSIDLPHPVKLCLCRFVQEALSNAFKHAGGVGQKVKASWNDEAIVIEVSDQGPGIASAQNQTRPALGLIGLRNRLESLGGTLHVHSKSGEGTRLTAKLFLSE
jgi:signal transduction histidine kinase